MQPSSHFLTPPSLNSAVIGLDTDRDAQPSATASTVATTRRRAQPKATRSTVDAQGKRKRHADAERERIHRKQSEVGRMRELVADLEQRLRLLSSSSTVLTVPPSNENPSWFPELDEDALVDATTASEKRELYVRALSQSGWLRREKASLLAQLDDFGLVEATIESLLKDLIDATIQEPIAPMSVRSEDSSDAMPAALRQVSYRDLLSDECYELMCDLVNESTRFTIHPDCPPGQVHLPSNALDWSALMQHDGKDVRFSLTKHFPNADLDQLTSSVWLAFHDSSVSRKIFSPTLRVEVLQRVSEDVLIVRWQIDCRKAVLPYVAHCRNLVFRWKTSDGYFVGCRTIEELAPVGVSTASNPSDGAFDQFYWAKFTQNPSQPGCQVTFAGRVGVGNGTSEFARFLCTEIPISIFRWESMVVGPLFNFTASA